MLMGEDMIEVGGDKHEPKNISFENLRIYFAELKALLENLQGL